MKLVMGVVVGRMGGRMKEREAGRESHGAGRWKPLIMALALQGGLLVLAGSVVVMVWDPPPEPVFEARPQVRMPQVERDHRQAQAEFMQALPMPDRVLLGREVPGLEGLPMRSEVGESDFDPLGEISMVPDAAGLLSGLSAWGQGAEQASAASFFGIEESGRRIVILFDISQSVVNKARASGVPMDRIREETIRLIEGLEAGTRFGLIQFSRVYESFQPELIPSSPGNRQLAIAWMRQAFAGESGTIPGNRGVRDYPRGIERVLEIAYGMEPDVIFLLSDGGFWRSLDSRTHQRVPAREIRARLAELRRGLPGEVRLHMIGFQMTDSDRREWERITRENGGTLRGIGTD